MSGSKAKQQRRAERYAVSVERTEKLWRAHRCLDCEQRLDVTEDLICRLCASQRRTRRHVLNVPSGNEWLRYIAALRAWGEHGDTARATDDARG